MDAIFLLSFDQGPDHKRSGSVKSQREVAGKLCTLILTGHDACGSSNLDLAANSGDLRAVLRLDFDFYVVPLIGLVPGHAKGGRDAARLDKWEPRVNRENIPSATHDVKLPTDHLNEISKD